MSAILMAEGYASDDENLGATGAIDILHYILTGQQKIDPNRKVIQHVSSTVAQERAKQSNSASSVVAKGTRVSFKGRGLGRVYWTQLDLDRIRQQVEKRAYSQVKVTSNYREIIIEATVDHPKVSLAAIRDVDMVQAIEAGGRGLGGVGNVGGVDSTSLDVTRSVAPVVASRIPEQPNSEPNAVDDLLAQVKELMPSGVSLGLILALGVAVMILKD